MVRAVAVVPFSPYPLVLVAAVALVACQSAGTSPLGEAQERPDLDPSRHVSLEEAGAGLQSPLLPEANRPTRSGSPGPEMGGAFSGVRATTDSENPASDTPGATAASSPFDAQSQTVPSTSIATIAAGTDPGGVHLIERPRNNPLAADLLDHWGHRRVQGIVEGLCLGTTAQGVDAAGLRALQAAAHDPGEAAVAPDLQDGDEVRILGTHQGFTYGRWSGGPADTLSITFDLSGAGPLINRDPAFQAMLERAGKAWSHRIADTWSLWHRQEHEIKGWLINGTGPDTRVNVGAGGEVSTGLEIDVRYADLPQDTAGWARPGTQPPGGLWEPRFAPLEIDREHLGTSIYLANSRSL